MKCKQFMETKIVYIYKEDYIYKSHCIYPPKIIQTSSTGRLQKKSFQYNDCWYVVSILQ